MYDALEKGVHGEGGRGWFAVYVVVTVVGWEGGGLQGRNRL